MSTPRYRSFDDFTRDEIRPNLRAGWSLDNINDPSAREIEFGMDPFEAALLEAEEEEEDE